MILDYNKNNIAILCQITRWNWHKLPLITCFADTFVIKEPHHDTWQSVQSYSGRTSHSSQGLFLGTKEQLEKIIQNKKFNNPISEIKKLNFDKNCNFPRFKLQECTDIKRVIKHESSDAVVVNEIELNDYKINSDCKRFNNTDDILILYSKLKNQYVILESVIYDGDRYYNSNFKSIYKNWIKGKNIISPLHTTADACIHENVIPGDSIPFYYGPVCLINSVKEVETLNKTINNYMKIIYDTELDQFISDKLTDLTEDDIDTLMKMLISDDESVRGMGIKLLSNYNVNSRKATMSFLLAEVWNKIRDCKAVTSVGFQQVLSSLKLDKKTLDNSKYRREFLSQIFNETNEEDKRTVKKLIIILLTNELNQTWKNIVRNYETFNIKLHYELE